MGLAGRPSLPPDKSIAHRAALLAALADGRSEIVGFPTAADPQSTLRCLGQLGVSSEEAEGSLFIDGVGLNGLSTPNEPLDCGNSATTMRLLSGILAGQSFESTLVGDESLSTRPMDRVADPLRRMGARIHLEADHAPVQIRGGSLRGITYELPVASAQVKSAILLAGLYAKGETTVVESAPSRDHTERMLALDVLDFGDSRQITIEQGRQIPGGLWLIPRDISAATYFLVAGAVAGECAIDLRAVGINPTRAAAVDVLRAMGLDIKLRNYREHQREPTGDLWVTHSGASLVGVTLDGSLIPGLIDELPILAVAAAFAHGTTVIRDASELRLKESDRITATVRFLQDMGADVKELDDGMVITGGLPLHGTEVDSQGDHRIAMAAAVAGLGAAGNTTIRGADCVSISFPGFWDELDALTGDG